MKLQIEVYQSRGRNVHVVLRGRSGSEAGFGDPDVFARYIEVCQGFIGRDASLPEASVAAFDADLQPYMASPVSR